MTKHIISLPKTHAEDLPVLFEFQLDPEGQYLAAFMPKDPSDKNAYIEKYTRHINDPSINMRTIKINDVIVGSIAKFMMDNEAEITYWLDKKFWGQGITTRALQEFLLLELTRPIRGRVAYDNYGSQKVLEKNGFIKAGTDKGFANAREAEIEEYIYILTV